MKVHVISDLHREHPFDFPLLPIEQGEIDADFIVMAGDIDNAFRLDQPYEIHAKTGIPVIHIAGNHEYYNNNKTPVSKINDELRRRSEKSDGVHFLENDVVTLPDRSGDPVRFVGACFWTDWSYNFLPGEAMKLARTGMNDYRYIWVEDDGQTRQLSPEDTLKWHQESRQFFETVLSEPFDGPTVAVTHHAAHEKAMRSPFDLERGGRGLQPAYGSDLTDLLSSDQAPDFWISGHTHVRCDTDIGNTRLISNAQGYFNPETGRPENKHFDDELIISLRDCPRFRTWELTA